MAVEIGRFAALISVHFKHRRERVPAFSDQALRRLSMPVLAIAGLQDTLLDSLDTKRRLESLVAGVQVRVLRDTGHFIRGETDAIKAFLAGG